MKKIREAIHYKSKAEKQQAIQRHIEQMELVKLCKKKYGYTDWYSFRTEKWGTKWGAYDLHINSDDSDIDKGTFYISFNTAWSPAIPIHEKLAEMYPDLHFELRCIDEGMGWGYTIQWDNGVMSSEESHEGDDLYEFSNEEFGGEYDRCPKCNEWYWADDEDGCWNCQSEEDDA